MRRAPGAITTLALLVALFPHATVRAQEPPPPVPCDGCWVPSTYLEWQYQLRSAPSAARPFDLWVVDMFDSDSSLVADLQATGGRVACYVSAGSWEDWRPDAGEFPDHVLGKELAGWPGERWLDVRALDDLGPLIAARLDQCVAKGFDAVDFDNVNGYANRTGFPLTATDQLAYNRWLANAAHERGLSVGLKNDGEQASELVGYFDFAIVEQCFEYRECALYRPFVDAGKAVLEVEYGLRRDAFCERAARLRFSAIRKRRTLGAWRRACP
jgi:hypothetical protein